MMAARAVSQAPAVAVVFNAVTLAASLSFDGFSAVNSEDSSIAPSAPRLRLVSLLPKAMLKQEERRAPVERGQQRSAGTLVRRHADAHTVYDSISSGLARNGDEKAFKEAD